MDLMNPLHPVLAQVPTSTWLSADFLDTWPGNEKASPAACAGWPGGIAADRDRRRGRLV
ncbi:MAG: hypothetical protein JWM19_446 [Actinomycetia bacterium]|nr:hypothetical protein [Actinomycetes bacterium]